MPITHPDTAPASADPSGAPLSTAAWNAAHSVPTLAEVLVAGNDVGVVDPSIQAGDQSGDLHGARALLQASSGSFGGTFDLDSGWAFVGADGGYGATLHLGAADLTAGAGAILAGGDAAGSATSAGPSEIKGGSNDDFLGALVRAYGADADHGYVFIRTDGVVSEPYQLLIGGTGPAEGGMVYSSLLSSGSGAPGGSFVSLLYLDTTGKHAYAWNGSGYTLISDYA